MAGGSFIKLGQWAATRPDILPPSLCSQLETLQSAAPSHGPEWNEQVIRKCFGMGIGEMFSYFDQVPIGSGTIAQVHRARLKKDESWVAVKICHPEVEEVINLDLKLLGFLARLTDYFIPGAEWLSLPSEIAVFSRMMHEQLDLQAESSNLLRFKQNFEATGKAWGLGPTVRFPAPVQARKQCLIEELVSDSSIPIDKVYLSQDTKLKQQVTQIGFRALMQMLLWDNFVHADLHPGNIQVCFIQNARRGRIHSAFEAVRRLGVRLMTPGPLPLDQDYSLVMKLPEETNANFLERLSSIPGLQAQLVILDCGLVTELSHGDFRNFTDLFRCLVVDGDGEGAGRLMIERSPEHFRKRVIDIEGFSQGMSFLIEPFFAHPRTLLASKAMLNTLRIDLTLNRLFKMCRDHHVRIDPAFTNLVMSLLCVEGLGRRMAPEMDLRPLLVEGALQYLVRRI